MSRQHKPITPAAIASVAGGVWLAVVTWGWPALLVAAGVGGLLLWRRPGLRGRVAAGLIAAARLAATVFGGRARWPTPPTTTPPTTPAGAPGQAAIDRTMGGTVAATVGGRDRGPSATPDAPSSTPAASGVFEAAPPGIAENVAAIDDVFAMFKVDARVTGWTKGPAVTRYEVEIGPGVKVTAVTALAPNLAYATGARPRLEAPIPGRSAIGIELPNTTRDTITFDAALSALDTAVGMAGGGPLRFVAGAALDGGYVIADLAALPHLLIAGTTSSGKSGAINSLLCTLLRRATPAQVRLLLIDPKRVELTVYQGVAHLVRPPVTRPRDAVAALEWLCTEMDHRYDLLAAAGTRNIIGYNNQAQARGHEPMPYLVAVVDELADLMLTAKAQVEETIVRLAQLARAAGIHLVIATQRPSVDVVTGLIKANLPSRWAFAVASLADSRVILDTGGAEHLLGRGDSLWLPMGAGAPVRLQGVWADDSDIAATVAAAQTPTTTTTAAGGGYQPAPELTHAADNGDSDGVSKGDSDGDDDSALLRTATELIITAQWASVSMLQRKLRIGYARAGRLLDQLEAQGIVGPATGKAKARTVLIPRDTPPNTPPSTAVGTPDTAVPPRNLHRKEGTNERDPDPV